MKLDLARLNHVLIPATKSERDAYRNGPLARRWRHFAWLFGVLARLTKEGRVLVAAAFVAVVFAGDVVRTESHVLVFATGSLLLASLFFTRAYRLTGVAVAVHSPRRVTVGEEMAITVLLRNDGSVEHRAIRVEQPLLPWDGRWTGDPAYVDKLAAGAQVSTVARVRFAARGEHHIDPFRAALVLPLGLAHGAPVRTDGVRFVVVPRVARVVAVTVPQNRRHQPGGVARASRTGDATDLLGVRPYRPGDPVRNLHARLWARHGSPMVREFQEEYFARIGVVVDTDADAASAAHFEAALSLAAGVIASLCRGEALVDVLVVGDYMQTLSLGRSLGSLDQALDILSAVHQKPGFQATPILARLGPHLERLSSVVLVLLQWEPARAALASAIRARDVGCLVLVVGDRASREPHGTTVPLDAIAKGEVLSL